MYSILCKYCILPQAVERRDLILISAASKHSVVWSNMQSLRWWLCGSFYSSEAVSRYMLWRHRWLKPQPSAHTAPNDKRAGSLGEGEGCRGVTAKRGQGKERRLIGGEVQWGGEEREMMGGGSRVMIEIQQQEDSNAREALTYSQTYSPFTHKHIYTGQSLSLLTNPWQCIEQRGRSLLRAEIGVCSESEWLCSRDE